MDTKPRDGTNVPELLETYPYSRTRKVVTANGAQPVPVGQVNGILVKWQLMKDGVQGEFPKQGSQRFSIKMFPEGPEVPDIQWSTVREGQNAGIALVVLLGDQYTFSARINAPYYAESPGYYRIQIFRYIFHLQIDADGQVNYIEGEVWIKVSAEDE